MNTYTIYNMAGDVVTKKVDLNNLRLRFHNHRIAYADGRISFDDTYYIEERENENITSVINYITAKYVLRSIYADCYMMLADDAAAHWWFNVAYYNYAQSQHVDCPPFNQWYADKEHALYVDFGQVFAISGNPAEVKQLFENWHYDSTVGAQYMEEKHDN